MQFSIPFATQSALWISGALIFIYVLHVRLRNQPFTRWSVLASIVGLVAFLAGIMVVAPADTAGWTQRAGVALALVSAVMASVLWAHQVLRLLFRRRHYDIECLNFHPAATRKL